MIQSSVGQKGQKTGEGFDCIDSFFGFHTGVRRFADHLDLKGGLGWGGDDDRTEGSGGVE